MPDNDDVLAERPSDERLLELAPATPVGVESEVEFESDAPVRLDPDGSVVDPFPKDVVLFPFADNPDVEGPLKEPTEDTAEDDVAPARRLLLPTTFWLDAAFELLPTVSLLLMVGAIPAFALS